MMMMIKMMKTNIVKAKTKLSIGNIDDDVIVIIIIIIIKSS